MTEAFGINEWVAIGSAALALVSFLFNWAVVARQTAMQAEGLKAQMEADLLAWANEAIDVLSEAAALAGARGVSMDELALRGDKARLMWRLSGIADRGRLFFPNLAPHAHGTDKEGAFKGFRPPVLDAVIFAYQRLERMEARNVGPDSEVEAFLRDCRRALVSEVQRSVDPRRRGRMMRKLAGTGHAREGAGFDDARRLAERLEAAHPGILVQSRDNAWVDEMRRHAKRGA